MFSKARCPQYFLGTLASRLVCESDLASQGFPLRIAILRAYRQLIRRVGFPIHQIRELDWVSLTSAAGLQEPVGPESRRLQRRYPYWGIFLPISLHCPLRVADM
jgi:hypothetical protein